MWITTWWWKKQNNPQSSTLVLPPRAWGVVWWISQAAAGWSQPSGNRQCWSRAITAVLIAAGMSRLTPTSSGRLGPPPRPPPPGGHRAALPCRLSAAGGDAAVLAPGDHRGPDRGRDVPADPHVQRQARPAQPPAQLLPPQERRQPARTRHQRDRLPDDGKLKAVAVIRILRAQVGLA